MPEISKVINKETLKLKVRNLEIYDVNLDKINNRCYNENVIIVGGIIKNAWKV